jgi:hypothetical protein
MTMKEINLINASVEPNDDEEVIVEPTPEPGGDILQEGAS